MSIIKAKDLDSNMKYYRLTNEIELHRGMQYKTGINTDILPFNPSGECSAGGLYFLSEAQLVQCCVQVVEFYWIREVTFDDPEEDIYVEKYSYKTHRFTLSDRIYVTYDTIGQYIRVSDNYIRNKISDMNFEWIKMEMRTIEICKIFVEKDKSMIKYVPEHLRQQIKLY